MRISDWSSDVCSSDLFDDARLKALLDEISGTRDGLSNFSKDGEKAATSIRKLRAEVDPLEAGLKKINDAFEAFEAVFGANFRKNEFEIGSASCRERVCQYE